MKFLLDSNVVIATLRGERKLLRRVLECPQGDIAIPSIAAYELFFGAYKSNRAVENIERLEAMEFRMLDFDVEDAKRAGNLRAHLEAAGTPIGPYDVLIAGQALARDLTLVTHNTREFSRAPGLKIEDWQAP